MITPVMFQMQNLQRRGIYRDLSVIYTNSVMMKKRSQPRKYAEEALFCSGHKELHAQQESSAKDILYQKALSSIGRQYLRTRGQHLLVAGEDQIQSMSQLRLR